MALSGPTLAPARGPTTHLVVLVHGYGADGQDLLGLANHWQGVLPTVAFVAPNAPTRLGRAQVRRSSSIPAASPRCLPAHARDLQHDIFA